ASVPSLPRTTRRTTSPSGSMVMTTSEAAARSRRVLARRPPRSWTNRAATSSFASSTVTGNPASTRRPAMSQPIFPNPTKPTVYTARSTCPALPFEFLDGFGRNAEAVHGCGHAAVDGHLQEHLADLLFGAAVA